jgi:aryl-alcohol dehydrogenase-like predicted oxidoreductase
MTTVYTPAELRGWTPFIGLQVEYSLIQRTPERDLLPMARALDIGVTAWGALGRGVLTGKYNKRTQQNEESEPYRVAATKDMLGEDWAHAMLSDRNMSIAQEVKKIANEIGRSPAKLS